MARDYPSARPVGAVVAVFILGYLVFWIMVGVLVYSGTRLTWFTVDRLPDWGITVFFILVGGLVLYMLAVGNLLAWWVVFIVGLSLSIMLLLKTMTR